MGATVEPQEVGKKNVPSSGLCVQSEIERGAFLVCMIFSVYEHVCYFCGVEGILTSSVLCTRKSF